MLILFPQLVTYTLTLGGRAYTTLDLVAIAIIVLLAVIYLATIIADARHYAAIDPKKKTKE